MTPFREKSRGLIGKTSEESKFMKIRKHIIEIISVLFIALWIYTAINKLLDVELFKSQLSRQALIGDYAGFFVWFLPSIEILAALLLMFAITRKTGMLLSFSLMIAFTVYVALAVLDLWKDIPCSCGGVLNQLGWKEHLWFNLFFTGIAGLGIYLQKQTALQESAAGS